MVNIKSPTDMIKKRIDIINQIIKDKSNEKSNNNDIINFSDDEQ